MPGLNAAIGPQLAQDQASAAAAALAASQPLPVALTAATPKAPAGPRVGIDFWTAPIGVRICGKWLANAPSTNTRPGVHSHGDGMVYFHPVQGNEAEQSATLGLFLGTGSWHVDTTTMRVWDGAEHRNGERCGDRPARVRWSVDGEEQHGDPSAFHPHNGQVIVLAFEPDGVALGTPPQATAPLPPALSARS